jgi:hypothetical protein
MGEGELFTGVEAVERGAGLVVWLLLLQELKTSSPIAEIITAFVFNFSGATST